MALDLNRGMSLANGAGRNVWRGFRSSRRKPSQHPPLRIGLVNLMPRQPGVAQRICAYLAGSGRAVDIVPLELAFLPCRMKGAQVPARTCRTWMDVRGEAFDGLVVSDAAADVAPFDAAPIWREFEAFLRWSQSHVGNRLFFGWSAQAVLHHHHGIASHRLEAPVCDIIEQHVFRSGQACVRGLRTHFSCPALRDSEVRWSDVEKVRGLYVAAASARSGVGLVEEPAACTLYMIDHLEYDARQLAREADHRFARWGVPRNASAATGHDTAWAPAAASLFHNWLDMIAARVEPVKRI